MNLKLIDELNNDINDKINNFHKNNFNCYNSSHLDLQVRFDILEVHYNLLVSQYIDDKNAFTEFKSWWFNQKHSKSKNIINNPLHSVLVDKVETIREPFSITDDQINLTKHLNKPLRPSNSITSSPSSSTTLQSSPYNAQSAVTPSKRQEDDTQHCHTNTPKKAKWDSDDELTPTSIKYLDYHNNTTLKFDNEALRKVRRKSDIDHKQNPYKNKGNGRYATSLPKSNENKSLNKIYPINPESNQGVAFKYKETVRKKSEREHMVGGDCLCCRDFWNSVGQDAAQEHKNRSSKHRSHWPRPKTPPGYWDVDFPSTQKIALNKEQARQMHKEKWEWAAAEANKDNGRHLRRKSS
ncbi:hypothetical protein E3Q19_00158 [Wallemia mellicola]|nr:hypothetical protein E3Q19_00158 [Wallemia mellicola]